MNLLSRLRRRSRAQTASEYMLMISVITLGLWVALKQFSDPGGPVQSGAQQATTDLKQSLSNDGGSMSVE